jgi:DNA-binding XRE family transcriptional regulator
MILHTKTVCSQAPTWGVHNPLNGRTKMAMSTSTDAIRHAFARRLAAARLAYGQQTQRPGITMEEFAAVLDIQTERYRKYERGEREPPLWLLAKIAQITGASLDHLVIGTTNRAA